MRIFFTLVLCSLFSFAKSQTLYFPPTSGNQWDTLSPSALSWCQERIDSLYNFLEAQNTKAFVVLKDGKIVLEKYFGTHTQNTVWQWASAGKTITSFMVGMAQQEGFLSINDTSSKYLGAGWTSCTPQQEDKIKVWNQLTMTSGLDDGVADPFCTIDSCLIFKADAGTRWAYHNGPYTLLDKVIENSTGFTLNQYTTQKLKTPTGMTGLFVPVDFNNVYFSNARSMARFGLLMLNKGNWNGNQIMTDTAYFNQMINTSQNLNKSYGYLWWLNGKTSFMVPGLQTVFPMMLNPNAPADLYIAMGKDGQFLNVVPSQNLVFVRMGNAPGGLPVPYLLNDEIWKYINKLNCSSSIDENKMTTGGVNIYPNPAFHTITIDSDSELKMIKVYGLDGQIIHQENISGLHYSLSVSHLKTGMYILQAQTRKGQTIHQKWIKN